MNRINITLLCKVIDNYGDIGVVYRLAKALSELSKNIELRLVVSDLKSFSQMAPQVNPNLAVQNAYGWRIINWFEDLSSLNQGQSPQTLEFMQKPPQIIIECFACGRPDWLETLLFDTGFPEIVHIINLEYLTAEQYADDFHKLLSLTRSPRVKKVNFMPGFTEKTGGLIIDETFKKYAKKTLSVKENSISTTFSCLVFSYERGFNAVVKAFSEFTESIAKDNIQFIAKVAPGKNLIPFTKAYKDENCSFCVENLNFMPQEQWDKVMYEADFLFIRGEDSLSRACLSGVPFIWHAYPQSEEYQLVKVRALLQRLKPFFALDTFSLLEECYIIYNTSSMVSTEPFRLTELLLALMYKREELKRSFTLFADSLQKNGNMARNLMTFIEEML